MFVSQRHVMLSLSALAFCLANSNAICVASSVSWRPALFGARPILPSALLKVRGGDATTTDSTTLVEVRGGDSEAEATLRRTLQDASTSGKFRVQGWRWHTMSVIREAERLQKLAQQTDDVDRMKKAADYVVNFNLKALHRVEAMFFPKMRLWMSDSKTANAETIEAFDKVVANLEEDQKKMAALGRSITHSLSGSSDRNTARTVASQSEELVDLAKSMLEREINLVMPAVGTFVEEKDQQKFNNQVIKFLGVLESRVHLVHMHEVVEEANSKHEQKLWEESIPSLPRSMIPRWKRTLYEPKAAALVMP